MHSIKRTLIGINDSSTKTTTTMCKWKRFSVFKRKKRKKKMLSLKKNRVQHFFFKMHLGWIECIKCMEHKDLLTMFCYQWLSHWNSFNENCFDFNYVQLVDFFFFFRFSFQFDVGWFGLLLVDVLSASPKRFDTTSWENKNHLNIQNELLWKIVAVSIWIL